MDCEEMPGDAKYSDYKTAHQDERRLKAKLAHVYIRPWQQGTHLHIKTDDTCAATAAHEDLQAARKAGDKLKRTESSSEWLPCQQEDLISISLGIVTTSLYQGISQSRIRYLFLTSIRTSIQWISTGFALHADWPMFLCVRVVSYSPYVCFCAAANTIL
jgi:hypothetical protein